MLYKIRESRLLFEHHALSGYVPMLALTYIYALACAYIHMYIHEQYNQAYIYTDIHWSHTATQKKLRFSYFRVGLPSFSQ